MAGLKKNGKAYQNKKLYNQKLSGAKTKAAQDIGAIPPVKDPKRKKKAEGDLEYFCQTYFPETIKNPFSEDHKKLIKHLEHCINKGGHKAFAMPRGSGKSVICRCAAMWSMITGRRKSVVYICQSGPLAEESIKIIKDNLLMNDLLFEDWPEVCHPIRHLDGNTNKAKGQHCKGEKTHIEWGISEIKLPNIKGSKASGAKIGGVGITCGIRGKAHSIKGVVYRPDLAIVDDPQTDASARVVGQVNKRLSIIKGTILGLAGPDRKIACFVPCTIMEPDDAAAQLLDRSKNPSFRGETCKMIYDWPTNMNLWLDYADLRNEAFRQDDLTGKIATKFYEDNRVDMDFGSRMGWEYRFDKEDGEIGALQSAMNLWIDNPLSFDAEYQNDPKTADDSAEEIIKASVLMNKINGLDRNVVPLEASVVTAFIDVHKEVLWYSVVAWSMDLTATVIDYGAWPDQKFGMNGGMGSFTMGDLKHPLSKRYPGTGEDGAVRAGLDELTKMLAERQYIREDSVPFRISRLMVDSGWRATKIYQFCRESQFSNIIFPSKGKGVRAKDTQISSWSRGVRLGTEWNLDKTFRGNSLLMVYDTNYWKTAVHAGLSLGHGDKHSISLFGKINHDHRLIASHLTAEKRKVVTYDGKPKEEWEIIPQSENHLLDCLVGCAVGASFLGCSTTFNARPNKSTTQANPKVTPLKW